MQKFIKIYNFLRHRLNVFRRCLRNSKIIKNYIVQIKNYSNEQKAVFYKKEMKILGTFVFIAFFDRFATDSRFRFSSSLQYINIS